MKPVNEGSSVGVIIVKEDRAIRRRSSARDDWPHGDMVLAENFVAGRELTCAVMGDRALGVIDIVAATRRLLRLRREICARRLDPRPSGKS